MISKFTIFAGIPQCTQQEDTERRIIGALILIAVAIYAYSLYKFVLKQNKKINKKPKEERALKKILLVAQTITLLVAGYVIAAVVAFFWMPLCN